MKYLLDSNTCIQFLNEASAGVKQKVFEQLPSDLAICSLVKAELIYGAYRSARVPANLQRLQTIFCALAQFPV